MSADLGEVDNPFERRRRQLRMVRGDRLARLDVLLVVVAVRVLNSGDVDGKQIQQRPRVVAASPAGQRARGLGCLQGQRVGGVVDQLAGPAPCNQVQQHAEQPAGDVVVDQVLLRGDRSQARHLLPPRSGRNRPPLQQAVADDIPELDPDLS